jgi:hypothetical protein
VAREDSGSPGSQQGGAGDEKREAEEFSTSSRVSRTPLFTAQHSLRYARQELIREYEQAHGANLIVVIDQIYPRSVTFLEELVAEFGPDEPLHMLFASPGGDGETAIRMIRSLQSRCSELTVLVPEQAKSAGTLLCLGANKIRMGPAGDLGPVDSQFQMEKGLVGAKEIVAAVNEADERVKANPNAFPVYANLLGDVNMVLFEQALSALRRSAHQVREALSCCGHRTEEELDALTATLQAPLIDEPASHAALISADQAKGFGLPVESFDPASDEWRRVWDLWTRYFSIGCWPAGTFAIYEGRKASHQLG